MCRPAPGLRRIAAAPEGLYDAASGPPSSRNPGRDIECIMFEVSVSGSFEASHYINAEGASDTYRKVHGHSFVVTASVAGHGPGKDGWVLDLGTLDAALKDTLAQLDHSVLNDIPGLEQPTFENLLIWIDGQLKSRGYSASRIEIERPTVRQRAVYTPGG